MHYIFPIFPALLGVVGTLATWIIGVLLVIVAWYTALDVLKNKRVQDEHKLVWLFLMLVTFPVATIGYIIWFDYFKRAGIKISGKH